MDARNIVSQRIEKVRTDRNLSQPQFAEALGLPEGKGRSTVNNWEQGAIQVKSDALILISKTFGVSADYLLGLSDVETVSADIRTACKTTGLSDEALSILSFWNKTESFALGVLDSLLDTYSEQFENLALSTRQAIACMNTAEASEERFEDSDVFPFLKEASFYGHITLNGEEMPSIPKGSMLLSAEEAAEFFKAKAVKQFSAIIDDLVKGVFDDGKRS